MKSKLFATAITEPRPPDEKISSEHGRLSYQAYLNLELERLRAKGERSVKLVHDDQRHLVALCRG